MQIDQGPTRHGVTRGYTVYFFDPVGNRNEVFTGGYWVDPAHGYDPGEPYNTEEVVVRIPPPDEMPSWE